MKQLPGVLFITFLSLTLYSPINADTPDNFRIRFMIDRVYDQRMVISLCKDEATTVENRARSMGIDLSVAQRIRELSPTDPEFKQITDTLITERYTNAQEEISRSIIAYQESWDAIITGFSQRVQELTEEPWFYESYLCAVSPFIPGASNWYGNRIIRKSGEDPVAQRWITAWEVILSHTFHIFRKYYTSEQVDDWKVWGAAEITAVIILGDEQLRSYWGDSYVPKENYFAESGYPQLADLEVKLREIYRERTSFREYVDKTVAVLNADYTPEMMKYPAEER